MNVVMKQLRGRLIEEDLDEALRIDTEKEFFYWTSNAVVE